MVLADQAAPGGTRRLVAGTGGQAQRGIGVRPLADGGGVGAAAAVFRMGVLARAALAGSFPGRQVEGEEAVAEWFVRYARSHGPVPVADFLWWTKLLKRDVAPVLDAARDTLEVLLVDGVEHWVDPAVVQRYGQQRRRTAAHLLLPGFDELVLGYGDRRAVLRSGAELIFPAPISAVG